MQLLLQRSTGRASIGSDARIQHERKHRYLTLIRCQTPHTSWHSKPRHTSQCRPLPPPHILASDRNYLMAALICAFHLWLKRSSRDM